MCEMFCGLPALEALGSPAPPFRGLPSRRPASPALKTLSCHGPASGWSQSRRIHMQKIR